MAKGGGADTRKTAAAQREARLKAALKANMARRKAQTRAREAATEQAKGDQPPQKKGS